jgi:hypothetical protein
MGPDLIHPEHVQTFERGVKGEICSGNFFDALFNHGSLLRWCGILLQTPSPARA